MLLLKFKCFLIFKEKKEKWKVFLRKFQTHKILHLQPSGAGKSLKNKKAKKKQWEIKSNYFS